MDSPANPPFGANRDELHGTTVFVLGAGCSAHCGLPVMQYFMDRAVELFAKRPQGLETEYRALFQFRDECRSASHIIGQAWENLEDLLMQAHLRMLTGAAEDVDKYGAMKSVIWDVYRRHRIANHAAYSVFAEDLCEIEHRRGEIRRPVVITTNYDVALESCIARFGLVYYPGLAIEPANSTGFWKSSASTDQSAARNDRGIVEVIKLHGSVNWMSRDDSVFVAADRITDGDHNDFAIAFQQSSVFLGKNKVRPLIVPPMLGKVSNDDTIRTQWLRAVYAIQHARRIAILGYSFPPSDLFMLRLLTEGLRANGFLRDICVANIDENEGELFHRVQNVFSTAWATSRLNLRFGEIGDFVLFDTRAFAGIGRR